MLFCGFFSWGFEVMQKSEWFATGHRSVGAPRGKGPAARGFDKSEETQFPNPALRHFHDPAGAAPGSDPNTKPDPRKAQPAQSLGVSLAVSPGCPQPPIPVLCRAQIRAVGSTLEGELQKCRGGFGNVVLLLLPCSQGGFPGWVPVGCPADSPWGQAVLSSLSLRRGGADSFPRSPGIPAGMSLLLLCCSWLREHGWAALSSVSFMGRGHGSSWAGRAQLGTAGSLGYRGEKPAQPRVNRASRGREWSGFPWILGSLSLLRILPQGPCQVGKTQILISERLQLRGGVRAAAGKEGRRSQGMR